MKIKFKLMNDLTALADGARFIPILPDVKGLVAEFADNPYGTLLIEKGPHSESSQVYGRCDADAVLPEGVEAVSDEYYREVLRSTHYNVPHREGWVFDEDTLAWVPPTPYPTDDGAYEWNEENQTWDKVVIEQTDKGVG